MNYLFGSSTHAKTASNPKPTERKLRVRIGASTSSLVQCKVNDDRNPHFIDSPFFCGSIAVRVKGFRGTTPDATAPLQDAPYFDKKKRLFSIQLSGRSELFLVSDGRFKQEYTVDDVVFGAEFDQKVSPPTGAWYVSALPPHSRLALKFANLIDPALLADIYCEKPWLFSPMLCSMNIVSVTMNATPAAFTQTPISDKASVTSRMALDETSKQHTPANTTPPVKDILGEWIWGDETDLVEDNALLFNAPVAFTADNINERRKYFQNKINRQATSFKTDRVYNLEIFAPFMDLNTFDLTLGINVNLVRYLNKQAIRLSAKSLSKNTSFFVIEFDLVDENGKGLNNAELETPTDTEFECPQEAHIETSEEDLLARVEAMRMNGE